MDINERKKKAGSDTPEDDVYILTTDGDIMWADNAEDAERVEKELKEAE